MEERPKVKVGPLSLSPPKKKDPHKSRLHALIRKNTRQVRAIRLSSNGSIEYSFVLSLTPRSGPKTDRPLLAVWTLVHTHPGPFVNRTFSRASRALYAIRNLLRFVDAQQLHWTSPTDRVGLVVRQTRKVNRVLRFVRGSRTNLLRPPWSVARDYLPKLFQYTIKTPITVSH